MLTLPLLGRRSPRRRPVAPARRRRIDARYTRYTRYTRLAVSVLIGVAAACAAPGARAPAARAPEARAPEARAPEARVPEARADEARAPEARAPAARAPEARADAPDTPASPATPPPPYDADRGLLVVFTQPGASTVDASFRDETLPGLRALCDELGVALHELDARAGAPDEVAITPLLVYQNHRGRSVFQGRCNDLGRIRAFLRTSRVVPQSEGDSVREDVAVARIGRAVLAAPLKISPVTGTPPADLDDAAFQASARRTILAHLAPFRAEARQPLRRTDRSFYMDFYPYRSADGTLFLSTALFSQFHCKEPVFRTPVDAPFTGPWSERERLFADAARRMAEATLEQRGRPELGDGFDALAATTPHTSWAALGLELPEAPKAREIGVAGDDSGGGVAGDGSGLGSGDAVGRRVGGVALGRTWRLAPPGPDDPVAVRFAFAPPLDQYAGEVPGARGELVLGEGLSFRGASGWVEVETASVTMGQRDLDEMIRGALTLDARRHPTARLELTGVEVLSPSHSLAFGDQVQTLMAAEFTMRGETVPVTVAALAEPIVAADGRARLLVDGRFELRLREPWDIRGPDGPAPANDTLVFDFRFELEPTRDEE